MKNFRKIKLLPMLLILTSCVARQNAVKEQSNTYLPTYEQSGMIAVASRLPLEKQELSNQIISFLSSDDNIEGNWLLVDIKRHTLSIKQGDNTLETFAIQGNSGLRPGIYSVFHKEQEPLWYANDNYYLSRNLVPPQRDSRERYVKGALGSYAIFLNDNFAIHDSKIGSYDVQGIRVDSNDIQKVYSSLKSGALVRVY